MEIVQLTEVDSFMWGYIAENQIQSGLCYAGSLSLKIQGVLSFLSMKYVHRVKGIFEVVAGKGSSESSQENYPNIISAFNFYVFRQETKAKDGFFILD